MPASILLPEMFGDITGKGWATQDVSIYTPEAQKLATKSTYLKKDTFLTFNPTLVLFGCVPENPTEWFHNPH